MSNWKNILFFGVILSLCSCATNRGREAHSTDIAFMSNHELSSLAESCFKKADYECAIKYLRPLANRGNAKATYALGYIYFYGEGITQNKEVGRSLIREAAALGDTRAVEALKRISESDISGVQQG